MTTPVAEAPAAPARGMRQRILDAANELFYAQGFRAVSAEKIAERVGITKVTFYRHFPSKELLMIAYLEQRAAQERDILSRLIDAAAADPAHGMRPALDAVAAGDGAGYRGCPFINAAAEYSDPAHPVRVVVARHRRWLAESFERFLRSHGVPDAELADAAAEFMILRDGVAVSSYLDDPAVAQKALSTAAAAILRARVPAEP